MQYEQFMLQPTEICRLIKLLPTHLCAEERQIDPFPESGEDEGTTEPWILLRGQRHDMEPDPGVLGRDPHQMHRLVAHDLASADLPPQSRLVDHRHHPRRLLLIEDPLAFHPLIEPPLDIFRL